MNNLGRSRLHTAHSMIQHPSCDELHHLRFGKTNTAFPYDPSETTLGVVVVMVGLVTGSVFAFPKRPQTSLVYKCIRKMKHNTVNTVTKTIIRIIIVHVFSFE